MLLEIFCLIRYYLYERYRINEDSIIATVQADDFRLDVEKLDSYIENLEKKSNGAKKKYIFYKYCKNEFYKQYYSFFIEIIEKEDSLIILNELKSKITSLKLVYANRNNLNYFLKYFEMRKIGFMSLSYSNTEISEILKNLKNKTNINFNIFEDYGISWDHYNSIELFYEKVFKTITKKYHLWTNHDFNSKNCDKHFIIINKENLDEIITEFKNLFEKKLINELFSLCRSFRSNNNLNEENVMNFLNIRMSYFCQYIETFLEGFEIIIDRMAEYKRRIKYNFQANNNEYDDLLLLNNN